MPSHLAYVIHKHGPPTAHRVEDVSTPVPEGTEVLIDVKAAGVNFPDLLIIQGKYQFQPPMPFVPGTEVSGIIAAIGEDVKGFSIGDSVIGMTASGAFSEKVIVDASKLMRLPPSMGFAAGAAITMAYGTSFYALKDVAQLRAGETLLVLGASGGVGLAAVELGKIMGAHVIAAASSAEKLAVCTSKGADEVIQYSPGREKELKAQVSKLTNGAGVDVCYDPVGGKWSEVAIRSMAWGGRFLVIGFAAGEIPRVPLNLPLLKNCSVMGVFWGAWTAREPERNDANMRQVAAWHAEGKLTPYTSQTFPLAQTVAALQILENRRAMGKVLITMDPSVAPKAKL